jgi:hypothetical protein
MIDEVGVLLCQGIYRNLCGLRCGNHQMLRRLVMRRFVCVSVSIAIVVLAANIGSASMITWETPATISADTDVRTDGTLNRAYDFGLEVDTTVNGVTFTPFENQSTDTLSSADYYDGYSSTAAPWTSLSADYRSLLTGGFYSGGTTLTLNGLTVGQAYLVQAWACDPRACGGGRSQVISGSATVDFNNTDAEGGVGQYVTGIFTADSLAQTLVISGPSIQLNALQLRDTIINTPEPGTMVLLGSGVLGLLAYAWRKRQ